MSLTWSLATVSSGPNLVLNKILWVPSLSKFVGVGKTNTGSIPTSTSIVVTSPDGVTWTLRTAAQGYNWTSLAFSSTLGSGSGRLLAVTSTTQTGGAVPVTDQVMYSDNGGVTWTSATSSERNPWNSVTWIGGSVNLFVAVAQSGTHRVMTSPDGITWTNQTAAAALTWNSIETDGSTVLVAVAGTAASTTAVMTSPDGAVWTTRSTPSNANTLGNNYLTYSSTLGMFVFCGRDTTSGIVSMWRSTNSGVTWNAWSGTPSGWPTSANAQIAWCPNLDGGLFISINSSSQDLISSPDGNVWTKGLMSDIGGDDFFHSWITNAYSPSLNLFVAADTSNHDVFALASGVAVPTDSVTPPSGHLGGHYSLTLTCAGGGFTANTQVYIDADIASHANGTFAIPGSINTGTDIIYPGMSEFAKAATNVVLVDPNTITCDAPIGFSAFSASRTADVVAFDISTGPAVPNISLWLPGGFTYLNPTLTSVTANTGTAAGGTVVTLTGTNLYGFGAAAASGGAANQVIFFNNTEQATSVTVNSSTSITLTTPAAVNVTNPVDITFTGKAWSDVRFAHDSYAYMSDAASSVTLPLSYTYTASWFLLDEIPAEFIELAQLDLDLAILNWTGRFGAATASYLAIKFNRLPFKFPVTFPLHWYIYQAYQPGTDWSGVSEPAKYGWFQSVDGYTGASTLVIGDAPHDPRSFTELASFAAGSAGVLGGFPGTGVSFRNHFIYASGGYTVGTTAPSLRLFDGLSDREVISLPLTTAGAVPKAVVAMMLQGETIYLSTLDSGTSAADYAGRVFAFQPLSGSLTQMGAPFTTGEVPYALCFHMGRLWCGTNKGNGTTGKLYYIRPGVDTAWTLDYTLSSSSVGGVCSLASFNGQLYVGADNALGSFAKVLARDSTGAFSTSLTATGGTAKLNNSFLYLKEFNSNLYATYWNPDTPTTVAKIYKFDGTTWSTVYNGATGTLRPYIGMFVSSNVLYTIGGGLTLTAVLLSSANGTSWTDLSAQLTGADATAVPVFGEVII